MVHFIKTFLFTSILFLVACSDRSTQLDFDSEAWKNDPKGCSGIRGDLVAKIKKIKPNLIGLDELTVLSVFGKPEKEQLSSRGTKTFYYYINGGRDFCGTNEVPWILSIDFGALNNVRMITFQRF